MALRPMHRRCLGELQECHGVSSLINLGAHDHKTCDRIEWLSDSHRVGPTHRDVRPTFHSTACTTNRHYSLTVFATSLSYDPTPLKHRPAWSRHVSMHFQITQQLLHSKHCKVYALQIQVAASTSPNQTSILQIKACVESMSEKKNWT